MGCGQRDRAFLEDAGSEAISAKVFVGNLSFKTTRDELNDLLSEAGEVVSIHLPVERETGKPRGFAFVEFATAEAAERAIRLFDGREVGGRRLRVNAAEERPRREEGAEARGPSRFGPRPGAPPRSSGGPRPAPKDILPEVLPFVEKPGRERWARRNQRNKRYDDD
jgi:nucleolin